MQYIEMLKTRGFLAEKEGFYVVGPRRGKCPVLNDQLFSEEEFVWESCSDEQLCVDKCSQQC